MSSARLGGIDVSKWQGAVDWTRVRAAGNLFAFVRATYGAREVDSEFAANWRAMRAAGLVRGAYHFFVTAEDAAAQAELFIKTVGSLEPGDLPPVLDVEAESGTGANLADDVRTWLDKVEQAFGVKPIIYTGPYFWNANMPGDFAEYPLWVAEYIDGTPHATNGWADWTFWQYSQTGTVAGVNGHADLDYFNGSPAELQALCVHPSSGTTATTSTTPAESADTTDTTTATTSTTSTADATSTTSTTGATAQTYTVRPGDSLDRIAERFGVSAAAICEANGISDPNRIGVGQVLTIPS